MLLTFKVTLFNRVGRPLQTGVPTRVPRGLPLSHRTPSLSLDTRRSGSDDCGRVNGEVNVRVFITYRLENFYSVCAWQTIVVYV